MLALALAAALSHAPTENLARVQSAIQIFQTSRPLIESEVGKDQALDIGVRLLRDEDNVQMPVPRSYAGDWNDAVTTQSALDAQSVTDLAAARRRPIDAQRRGVYEAFVVSSTDGTWIPVAVYVPQHVKALALLLHGNEQPETNLLGQPYFRRLAERTGTVLVAPWARGTYDYQGVAQSDVYDALRAAQSAFHAEQMRTYLVGYSMGGFSMFKIGPSYKRWTAVMDVCGAVQDAWIRPVSFAWRSTPLYVVTGKRDSVIPPLLPEETATVLAAAGVPTSFYEQSDGQHMLRTLAPSLAAAWMDMHTGVVHSGSVPGDAGISLAKMPTGANDEMKP